MNKHFWSFDEMRGYSFELEIWRKMVKLQLYLMLRISFMPMFAEPNNQFVFTNNQNKKLKLQAMMNNFITM